MRTLGGPSRSSSIAPAETILRRARFFGTHAPRDKENKPEMPERKHAGAPRCCFGATPLVGELPRSNRQTTAWPAAPSRPRKVDGRGKRGARKSINLNPDLDLLSSPSRSSSIAPPKPYFAAPDSSAPTRQGIKRTSPQNA